MRVLVVNAGSSSLKLRVLDGNELVAREDLPPVDQVGRDRLSAVVSGLGPVDAVGHRVVHGGAAFTGPVLIDAGVRRTLDELVDLAPIHQRANLDAVDAVGDALPGVPAVACFDTAFHATLPAEAATYPLPEALRRRWGLRRYGFHGLSHAYVARRAAELLGQSGPDPLRIVSCHLGSGASLAAVAGGRCVDTTMGFTPNDGLVMATRSGSLDPGLVLWLVTRAGMTAPEVTDVLDHESGLLGLAGSADMAEVVARAEAGDERCAAAIAVYVHRLRQAIAAMAVSLGGVDVVVFTGGVGEHAPHIRALAVDGLGLLGLAVDHGSNAAAAPDCEIGTSASTARILVVEAREDLEIARATRSVVGAPPGA